MGKESFMFILLFGCGAKMANDKYGC